MPGQVPKFASIIHGERLRQCEVLTGLFRVRQTLESIGLQDIRVDEFTHPYLIVMTQDCDLAQDADARIVEEAAANDPCSLENVEFKKKFDNAPKLKIDNILLCEAMATSDMKVIAPPGKDIWKRIIQNKDERYQCLESVPSDLDATIEGLPSLSCDFKRFITLPVDEVYKRLKLNPQIRRTRLLTPYAEHLLHRFYFFQSRIPLPEHHDVQM